MKKAMRAMTPIAALVLVAACSDATGPGAPELSEIQEERLTEADDPTRDIGAAQTETKRKLPLEQEREDER